MKPLSEVKPGLLVIQIQIQVVKSNNMEFLLFFLRKFSILHALLEPPRLLISEKPDTNTVFYVMNIKKIPTTCLIRISTFI